MKMLKISLAAIPLADETGAPLKGEDGRPARYETRKTLYAVAGFAVEKRPDSLADVVATEDLREAIRTARTDLLLSRDLHETLMAKLAHFSKQLSQYDQGFSQLVRRVQTAEEVEVDEVRPEKEPTDAA